MASKLASRGFFKFIVGTAFVVSSVVSILIFLDRNQFFNIETIDIVIENSTDQARYLQSLVTELNQNLEVYKNSSLWRIDLKTLNKNLNELSWVREVSIMRVWPRKLKITVVVKEVRFLLLAKNGKFIPVVGEGELLASVQTKQIPDVAILRSEVFEDNSELRKRVVKVMDEIPKEGSFSRKSISEVYYDDKNGFWFTLVKDAMSVKMGDGQIAQKSVRVGQVLDYIDSRKMSARVIDANLSKKVLVRLRKGP